jgi:TfoX/Sxy family transcriptional regulator of competence genes
MKWKKPSEKISLFLEERLKNVECQSRTMFGCPSYFINDNMFIGAYGDDIFIRLAPADIEETLKTFPHAKRFEPRPGRVMKEYVALQKSVYTKKEVFSDLLRKSLSYTRSLTRKKRRLKRN